MLFSGSLKAIKVELWGSSTWFTWGLMLQAVR